MFLIAEIPDDATGTLVAILDRYEEDSLALGVSSFLQPAMFPRSIFPAAFSMSSPPQRFRLRHPPRSRVSRYSYSWYSVEWFTIENQKALWPGNRAS